MLKKILYIIASFLIGFMLISSIVVTNFYSVFQKFVAEDVNNKEYTSAERFFSRVVNENKFYSQEHDGVFIEVYSALNDDIVYAYDENGEVILSNDQKVQYYTLESSIQFTFFNLPDTFALADDTSNSEDIKRGGVKLLFGESDTLFFPFVTDTIDYYGYASSYSYLPLSISYSEYIDALTKAEINSNAVITGAIIIDGNGEEEYTLTFGSGNNPSFNTTFHNDFYDVLVRYNDFQEASAKGSETSEDEANSIKSDYERILNSNSAYLTQHDFNLIYGSFDFLFAVISSAVVFLAVDILLGWFIFRKKKAAPYIPPSQRKQQATVQRQPEQFTRDVFNVEEMDVIEAPSEEVGEATVEVEEQPDGE